jgi:hypothetical protein
VQGWFLEVQGDDSQLVAALHKSIAAKYCSMLGQDSHGCGKDATRLAAAWLQSLESALQEGKVLVNPAGGFVAKRDLIVLAEIKRRDLTWPEQFADEIITISRWPQRPHYYLCSNRGRVFVPEKFTTYRAARLAALRYVTADRIESRE